MKARTRTRLTLAAQGKITYPHPGNNPPVGPWTFQKKYEEIQDYYDKIRRFDGTLPPSDLFIMKEAVKPTTYSYVLSSFDGFTYINASGLPCLTFGAGKGWIGPTEWFLAERDTTEGFVAKLLADTNPFRYEVSVPIMVFELLEASTLLNISTKTLFTMLGGQHLNYTFGWAQLLSDVKSLVKITSAIESRIKEFNSLVQHGGLRRFKKLYKGSASGPLSDPTDVWSTHGFSLKGQYRSAWASEVTGSCRWRPKRGKAVDINKLAVFNQAAKIVFDIQPADLSTVWESIPFSWLADYFLNIGDTLLALEGSDLVEPYDICIMRHRTVHTSTEGWNKTISDSPWHRKYVSSPGHVYQEFKLRTVVPTPTDYGDLLSFGIMSKAQATNLIALLISVGRLNKR